MHKGENPYIQQYRGYVDWKMRYGCEDGLIFLRCIATALVGIVLRSVIFRMQSATVFLGAPVVLCSYNFCPDTAKPYSILIKKTTRHCVLVCLSQVNRQCRA